MVFAVRSDYRAGATVLNAQRPHIHAFTTGTHAAVAENAAWTVKVNHRRPLLLFLVQLAFHVARFSRAVLEGHVLQFAFATGIAYGTIQRMIAQQKLDHGFAGLADFIGVGGHNHSLS